MMIPQVDNPAERPAGWEIHHGVLSIYRFDAEGRSYCVLSIELWNPLTGEWLVDPGLIE